MRTAVRWIFILLPCAPGLTLLLAAALSWGVGRGEPDVDRIRPLLTAGGVVLLAGMVIGAFVAWRIAHPRPEPDEEG